MLLIERQSGECETVREKTKKEGCVREKRNRLRGCSRGGLDPFLRAVMGDSNENHSSPTVTPAANLRSDSNM